MTWPHHQLPAYSPLPAHALFRGIAGPAGDSGEPAARLRRLLRDSYAAEQVVLCGSGTQALRIAIRWATRPPRRRVVALPAYGCFDLVSAAVGADCRIVLYDLEPNTLGPGLESLERCLRGGAGAVVAAPLHGVPLAWEALAELADRYGAELVEDAAQGHDASWRGVPLGALGRLSVLSFGRGKGWTGGGGGALLARHGARLPEVSTGHDDSSRELRSVVRALAQWALGRPSLFGLPMSLPGLHLGETRYLPPTLPEPLARAACHLLLATFTDALAEGAARRCSAATWIAELSTLPVPRLVEPPAGATPGWLRLPLLLPGGLAAFADPARARRLGAAPGYPVPLSALAAVRERLAHPEGRWPGAVLLARDLVTLPTHSLLRSGERDALLRLLRQPGLDPGPRRSTRHARELLLRDPRRATPAAGDPPPIL